MKRKTFNRLFALFIVISLLGTLTIYGYLINGVFFGGGQVDSVKNLFCGC